MHVGFGWPFAPDYKFAMAKQLYARQDQIV